MMEKPEIDERVSLEEIAMVSMEFGRLLMECGASARIVEETGTAVARGLGVERVDLRIGYASLAITVGIGQEGITRMRKVGPLGVNQRLDHSLRELAETVRQGRFTAGAVRANLDNLVRDTPRHPGWVVDLAVGGACASFGRLLGVDWAGIGPVFLAAVIGQWFRRQLLGREVNAFITATLVAFIASVLCGLGARLVASQTVDTAMIAGVLLLVPGVPSLNAQNDILEGRPTLGSARAVWVVITLVFVAVGVWLGQMLLAELRAAGPNSPTGVSSVLSARFLLHQGLFGGLAAVGFGVLFNMDVRGLVWCGAGGALALAIRTIGIAGGCSLEASSFAAALAAGSGVQIFQERIGVSRNTFGVASCIPMIPGSFAAKAILGLFALTAPTVQNADQTLILSVQNALRVLFTIGAMGTGLAIPSMLLRVRQAK